jgi:hypothetical protein
MRNAPRAAAQASRSIAKALFSLAAALAFLASTLPTTSKPGGDLPLGADARLVQISARSENGSGQDQGTFLPPIASERSEILGKIVDAGAPGPYSYYLAIFDRYGRPTYWRGVTDAAGSLHFRLPAGAGGVQLFRRFDAAGHPDDGARCEVTARPRHLPDTQPIAGPISAGPAIVEANSVYKISDPDNGIMRMQTVGVSPESVGVIVDKGAARAELLAASDRSVVAQFERNTPLGRHEVALQTGGTRTNRFPCDLVALVFDPLKPLGLGSVAPVTVHVVGLPTGEAATIQFTVTGAATLASGALSTTLPLQNQSATIQIRGVRPGTLVVTSTLNAALPQFSNEQSTNPPPSLPPVVYPPQTFPTTVALEPSPKNSPKQSPKPSPSPKRGPGTESGEASPNPGTSSGTNPSAAPSPAASPTTSPTPEPSPSPSPSPTPPCDYRIVDGWFEPTQGVWQDDVHFEDAAPPKLNPQLIRLGEKDSPPRYTAELPMVAARHSVLIGVHHYYQPWPDINVVDSRQRIVMKIRTNCVKKVGVKMRFTLSQGASSSVVYKSDVIGEVELDPPRKNSYSDVLVVLNAPLGVPPKTTFTFAPGGYAIVDDLLRSDDTPTGMSIEVSGRAKTTNASRIRFIPLVLGSGDNLATLKKHAATLEVKSRTSIPDYFPVVPGGLPTTVDRPLDLSAVARRHPDDPLSAVLDSLRAINATPSTDRIIALVGPKDYALLGFDISKSPATTYTGNVIVMADPNGAVDSALRVGHEVAHTIPKAIWSSHEMIAECGRDYHNVEYKKDRGWADGIRLDLDGRETTARFIFVDFSQLMGGVKENKWITQCTYRNVLEGYAVP